MPDDPYSLADLARLADVTPRTVRYYVAQGLLPSPDAAGPATRYGEGHLGRLRLIRRLQRDHLPLAEIRARLERMGDEEVVAAAAVLDPVEPEPSLAGRDTLDFVRSLMRDAGVRPTVIDAPVSPAPAPVSPAPAPVLRRMQSLLARSEVASRPALPAGELAFHAAAAPAPGPAPDAGAPASAAPAPMPAPAPPVMASPPGSAAGRTAPDRTTWERRVISPDVELHVRRPLDRQTNKRLDQLERIARELFEDP